jgi:hypothetical protein
MLEYDADCVVALATPLLAAKTAELMETALAAEEMKKSRRSMEGSPSGTLCFATSRSRDACDACDAGHVNADAVAATKARGATNLIMVVCYRK